MKKTTKWAVGTGALVLVVCLLGCSPEQADRHQTDGGSEAASSAFAWSAASDCSTCHSVETASMEDPATAAFAHGEEGDACVTCHTDEAALSKAHEDAHEGSTMPEHADATDVSESTCLSCHGSYEDLAARTDGSDALVDTQGTVANPHALGDVADHESISCSDCHKMHASEPAFQTAKDKCTTCHHQNVFECYTCHE